MSTCEHCGVNRPYHEMDCPKANRTAPAAPMGEELPARIVINSDGSTSTRISEYENDLENDLAAIRDLFPTPDFGELHNLWSEACSEPRAVAAYVKAQFDTQAERIRQLERELALRKTESINNFKNNHLSD
jgi:hypothetical protein